MTQDEILKASQETGMDLFSMGLDRYKFIERLTNFAKLVAAKEREACLEICRERMKDAEAFCKRVGGEYHEGRRNGAVQIEKRILERNSQ